MQQKSIALVLCLVAVASATGQQRRDEQPVSRAEIAELWERLSKMQSDVNAMEVEREFLQKINNIANAETTDCIDYIRVQARTGTESGADQNPYYGNSMLAIELTDGSKYSAYISGYKEAGSDVVRDLKVKPLAKEFSPDLPSCITANDIHHVYLEAASGTFTDGWYVYSINTYTVKEDKAFTPLTSDPSFNKWVDYDEQTKYPYNARSIQLSPLSMVSETMVSGDNPNCITKLKIEVKTGNEYGAGSDSIHYIQLTLEGNINLQGNISSPAKRNEKYTLEMDFANDFDTTECVELSNITGVSLIAGGNDNWYIASIKTYIKVGTDLAVPNTRPYTSLTSDPDFKKWLDDCANCRSHRYPYDATNIPLSIEDTPHCGYGQPVCECSEYASKCIINLVIDEIRTFTSYQKFPINIGDGIFVRGVQGVLYYINDDGKVTTHPRYNKRKCANRNFTLLNETDPECSEPQFVDGKTYRMAIGVNALIPGPTIIVHDQQKVAIHVHNNLSTQGISIHWHGMVQYGTPWMDGVGQVTQCQIGPSSSYSYVYTASPSGTFWYHSHSGAQRTDGFFGALIVKERPDSLARVKTELSKISNISDFEDLPGEHSITLFDWQLETSLDSLTQISAGLGFFNDVPFGEVPPPNASTHSSYSGYENAGLSPLPFFSGIINGKGRHSDVPYAKTRLSVFTVEHNQKYRFRLIGTQGVYAYKFSIDEHKLTVVSTDGYWIEPQKEVDFIIIHTGERYDFILDAKNEVKNYWMRAETLEVIYSKGKDPPYETVQGHVAEAILQYKISGDVTPVIPSTEYESIKNNSRVVQCTDSNPCKAINCPFENFHSSYYTKCVNVRDLRLLEPTPSENLPDANPSENCSECLHFLNFNFEGESSSSSINGRNFVLPPVPPQTQYKDFQAQAIQCDLTVDCNPSTLNCMCTHVIDIPYNKTVQFVLSAAGPYNAAHPIHVHGHTFHVVHVAYPSYDNSTGFISKHNEDIECGDNCNGTLVTKLDCVKERCTKPAWKQSPTFSINPHTVRKDTIIIPAGGYAVINFISDNPGYWFLHCHIEVHQLEGMALIFNEAFDWQPQAPAELNTCGDFSLSVTEYEQILLAPVFRSGQGKNSTDQYL